MNMTPSRKNLLTGILIGIFLAGAMFYFRNTISEQAPPFLIGFLTCLALITCLVIFAGIWFRKQLFARFFGEELKETDSEASVEKTVNTLAKRYLPEATEKEVQIGVEIIQRVIWGRAVYMFLGIVVSIFLVMGGLIGSILIFKQNGLLYEQTQLIALQDTLLSNQNQKLDRQNGLFGDQNRAVSAQTGLLGSQNSLLQTQNDFVKQQTDLLSAQVLQIEEQNRLFRNQVDRMDTEIDLLRVQDSLLGMQNAFIQEQTDLFGTQVGQMEDQNQLLLRQDSLARRQIAQIEIQNGLLQNQIYLSEAERRSSLNFLLGDLLDQINRELKGVNPFDRSLSDETIGRIAGLSQSFKPYRYVKGDSLMANPLSPERAQLLISLVNSNLSGKTSRKIFKKSDFSFAALQRANLRGAKLFGASLRGADLGGAKLAGSSLDGSSLDGANLSDAELILADLSSADLSGADLSGANLSFADLRGTDLRSVDLTRAELTKAKLFGASLIDADLSQAKLKDADLRSADLTGASLRGTDLRSADLRSPGVKDKNLRRASLRVAYSRRAALSPTFPRRDTFMYEYLGNVTDTYIKSNDLSAADLRDVDLRGAFLSEVKYTTSEQFEQAKSLFQCSDLAPELEDKLKSKKPCLFTEKGCK